jgi:hypothetical protein
MRPRQGQPVLRATRHATIATIALLAALAVLGANLAPASAASCYSTSCNGRDPQVNGCATGARTIEEFVSPADGQMRVELRYSSACNAAWARATVGAQGMPPHEWLLLYTYSSRTAPSPSISYWKKMTNDTNNLPPHGTQMWSVMHSFTNWVQACIKNIYEVGPCTVRR